MKFNEPERFELLRNVREKFNVGLMVHDGNAVDDTLMESLNESFLTMQLQVVKWNGEVNMSHQNYDDTNKYNSLDNNQSQLSLTTLDESLNTSMLQSLMYKLFTSSLDEDITKCLVIGTPQFREYAEFQNTFNPTLEMQLISATTTKIVAITSKRLKVLTIGKLLECYYHQFTFY